MKKKRKVEKEGDRGGGPKGPCLSHPSPLPQQPLKRDKEGKGKGKRR